MCWSSREVESSLLLKRTDYYSHNEFHLCNESYPHQKLQLFGVHFGRIWPYKGLWEGTDLPTVRTCFQPSWRVPIGPSLLQWQWPKTPVGLTGLQGQEWSWELQTTRVTNCLRDPKAALQHSRDRRCSSWQWGSALNALLTWHCTGLQLTLFESLLRVPCAGLLPWVHKCSFSWRNTSVLK